MKELLYVLYLGSRRLILAFAFALVACAPVRALTQRTNGGPSPDVNNAGAMADADSFALPPSPVDTLPAYHGRADSLASTRTRLAARKATDIRVLVSVSSRQLWVLDGRDTLYQAPVAVGMGRLLEYGGRKWVFATPRGVRTIKNKRSEPLWKPPDWHYAEVAREYKLKLAKLPADKPLTLSDGRQLVVRDSLVGVMVDSVFEALPTDEHIVFDSTLYVPPIATRNRRIEGELGRFQLDMGNGYLLHGTPQQESIGSAVTHGCVRLKDEDIEWLYDHVPVGTKVYIF